ncbi:UDPGP type 1 family protein [Priestia taiwanensis]|uniref:Uridylyltransferase n=1 Tax=Priestia taiwanensis TaxID=1347902 RepID=A0A917AQS0_9BACI|nr:UDPGP type 1 family protein [Priestia taiwanensis]MBM7363225.1 UDP-N-acetylglucosamine pyrophosphorylase [Priestia taiwanensis]GGE68680.1 putative uridylyltransferase [Priestia taiwanensis]
MYTYENTVALLQTYNQEHLLAYYNELTAEAQQALLQQIHSLNFDDVTKAIDTVRNPVHKEETNPTFTPNAYKRWKDIDVEGQGTYLERGWELLRENKVAIVLVAGGQGSRLGHDGPKGTYNIGLPSHKSLFHLQAERLMNINAKAGNTIHWYIMTSPHNEKDTKDFFEKHNFFGYDRSAVTFFNQNLFPAIDADGKIMLEDKGTISLAPNGNGGVFNSLLANGFLQDMKNNGVKWVFLNNIDNALVKVADPKLIGFADIEGAPICNKCIPRIDPNEKVGMLCEKDGRPFIVEYSDLDDELKLARNEKNDLLFENANIGIHMFDVDFLVENAHRTLAYHLAHKKIKTLNEQGESFTPEEPNGYKLEQFLFDVFPFAERASILQVNRDEEFAPVKNKEGEDSPESARTMLLNLHKKWLLTSGVRVTEDNNEVSPLDSYEGEGL